MAHGDDLRIKLPYEFVQILLELFRRLLGGHFHGNELAVLFAYLGVCRFIVVVDGVEELHLVPALLEVCGHQADAKGQYAVEYLVGVHEKYSCHWFASVIEKNKIDGPCNIRLAAVAMLLIRPAWQGPALKRAGNREWDRTGISSRLPVHTPPSAWLPTPAVAPGATNPNGRCRFRGNPAFLP